MTPFDLNSHEVGVVQDIWRLLDFCPISKAASSTASNVDINNVKFKFGNINWFHERMMMISEDHGISVTAEEADIINYQFDQIVQLMTLIILNLKHLNNADMELLMKFSKINTRIYQLNLSKFGQLLVMNIIDVLAIDNTQQHILLHFLNQFFNMIIQFSGDPVLDSMVDVNNDYSLSLSDSNLSNLSLHNVNDLDVSSNLDSNSIITMDHHASPMKLKPSIHSVNNSPAISLHQKHKRQSSLTKSPHSTNVDLNSVNSLAMEHDTPRSIDIDQLEELTDDLDDIDSISTNDNNPHLRGHDDDDDDDDTFDLLNSFAGSSTTVTNNSAKNSNSSVTSAKTKKMNRLSSINLRASKQSLNLSRVGTNASTRTSKQECIIM